MFAWAFPLHALGGSVGFAPQTPEEEAAVHGAFAYFKDADALVALNAVRARGRVRVRVRVRLALTLTLTLTPSPSPSPSPNQVPEAADAYRSGASRSQRSPLIHGMAG